MPVGPTDVFDILLDIITSEARGSHQSCCAPADLGEASALVLSMPIDLAEKLHLLWGCYKQATVGLCKPMMPPLHRNGPAIYFMIRVYR
jgi:hypothetical protein